MRTAGTIILALTVLLHGQGSRIEAEWSADTVLIGESVMLRISAQTAPNAVPHFPGLTLTNEEISLDSTHFAPNSVTYNFTFWGVGQMVLPGIPVLIDQPDGSSITMTTDSMSVMVVSSLEGSERDIRGIKDMVPLKLVDRLNRWKNLGLLTLLVALIVGIWIKRRKEIGEGTVWKRRQPGEVALASVGELREQIYHPYDAPAKYQELSGIVRMFIEERYLFRAMEMTTSEIKQMLPEKVPDLTIGLLIGQILEQCDLAKFARQKHPQNKWRNDLDLVERIVQKTRASLQGGTPSIT